MSMKHILNYYFLHLLSVDDINLVKCVGKLITRIHIDLLVRFVLIKFLQREIEYELIKLFISKLLQHPFQLGYQVKKV